MSDKMAYANSADPDQTAPSGAVWSGSALFAIKYFKKAKKAKFRPKKYEITYSKF